MSHLTTFKLKLKVLSPVFIGQGSEINKKEYLYFPDKNRIFMLDLPKFIDFLDSKVLIDGYKDFMLSKQSDLRHWLEENTELGGNIPYENFISYDISAGDDIDEYHSLNNIDLFIKDKRGAPYIPGSSLKGAIRTAILVDMLSDPDRHEHAKKSIEYLNDRLQRGIKSVNANLIESWLLNTLNLPKTKEKDAVNSVMKGIEISDSEPLETTSLVLCRKIDVRKNGKINKTNVYRECLEPGTEVEFRVTIDNIIAGKSGITKEYLRSAIIQAAKIQNREYDKFQKPEGFVSVSAPYGCELYLGGGAGFVSKTFVFTADEAKALDYVARLMQESFKKGHYHHKDKALGVSPHMLKCTSYNNNLYQMGKCQVEF